MGKSTKKIRKGKAAGVITGVCFLAVSVPVFAYQLPGTITEMEVSENDPGWGHTDILAFTREGDINDFEPEIMHFDQTDAVFINEAGVVYYENVIRSDNQSQTNRICQHNYESGNISRHSKNADGSCTVITYRAKRCTKCEAVITESEISTFTYKVCPH